MSIKITKAGNDDSAKWNNFIRENCLPIGAFMQTWEWGEFKKSWGKKSERFFVKDRSGLVAVFTLEEHPITLGLVYGYIPRGPVFAKFIRSDSERNLQIIREIKKWVSTVYPKYLFLRLEPPVERINFDFNSVGLHQPDYYIQPRHNHAVRVDKNEDDIISGFHPSARSNIHRAEKRGVTYELTNHCRESCYDDFKRIGSDTIDRNSGKNVYPSKSYFEKMFSAISPFEAPYDPNKLTIATFYGYHQGTLAAIHFVLFFGKTATYLYGASSTEHLSSKVTTYLHWSAMREAHKLGMEYYDLGGIDEKLWPSLTSFKRQFRGEEFTYVGNLDIPQNRALYWLYNKYQALKRN